MAGLGKTSNVLSWLFWSLAAVAVGLRLAGSRSRGGYLRLDDYLMVVALVLNLVATISNSIAIHNGLGEHVHDPDLNPETIPKAGLWAAVAVALSLLADVIPKLAVALTVNRILLPRLSVKWFHIVLALLLNIYTSSLIVLVFLQCHPVAHQWDPTRVPGTCLPPTVLRGVWISGGALSSFVDLYFSVYPPIVISRLNMPLRKKITTAVIMSLGLFTLSTTLYKTAAVLPALTEAQADITYVLAEVVHWGLLESSVTMIAGSIPIWGWLFRIKFENLLAWTTPRSRSALMRIGSEEEEAGIDENDNMGRRNEATGREKGHAPQVVLDSIGELERSATR